MSRARRSHFNRRSWTRLAELGLERASDVEILAALVAYYRQPAASLASTARHFQVSKNFVRQHLMECGEPRKPHGGAAGRGGKPVRLITHRGQTQSLAAWLVQLDLPRDPRAYKAYFQRLFALRWSVASAFTTPLARRASRYP